MNKKEASKLDDLIRDIIDLTGQLIMVSRCLDRATEADDLEDALAYVAMARTILGTSEELKGIKKSFDTLL